MINISKHLDLLGHHVQDRVTGFSGVAASVTFDLYGCIQAIVNPGVGQDGRIGESQWFDVNRLVVTSSDPVMERPKFDWSPESISLAKKGCADRPSMNKA